MALDVHKGQRLPWVDHHRVRPRRARASELALVDALDRDGQFAKDRIISSGRLRDRKVSFDRIDTALVPEEEIGDEGPPSDDAPPDTQEIELLRDVERNLAAVCASG